MRGEEGRERNFEKLKKERNIQWMCQREGYTRRRKGGLKEEGEGGIEGEVCMSQGAPQIV